MLRAAERWFRCPTFGKYLELDELKYKILQAAKRKEKQFPDLMLSYVSAAFFIPKIILERVRWDVVFSLFAVAVNRSLPTVKIPLLRPHKSKGKKDPWDYEGRERSMYSHIIAQAYGWSIAEIGKLEVNFALKLIQEILTDEQLDREFLWAMSDKSYSYDAKTKVGKENPLERPYFMLMEVQEPKKIKILKSMMPVGAKV